LFEKRLLVIHNTFVPNNLPLHSVHTILQYKPNSKYLLKQEPQKQPMPLELDPIRLSIPIALATSFTSAPVFHKALT
jgi:hypothetical protein